MKTKILLIAFAVVALIQLAIPGQMVYENELAYTEGTEYKFKTKPIAPYRHQSIRRNFIVIVVAIFAVNRFSIGSLAFFHIKAVKRIFKVLYSVIIISQFY